MSPVCCNKVRPWVAYRQCKLISPRAGDRRCWPDWFLVSALSWCSPMSSRGGGRELFAVPLIRALVLFMRSPPLCPNYFPKAPPPNTNTLGIKISIYSLRGQKHSDHNTPPSECGYLVSQLTEDEKSLGVEWMPLSCPLHLACAPVPLSPST